MNEIINDLIAPQLSKNIHIVVLDDGDTFGPIYGAHVIMNAVLSDEENTGEFDLNEFSKTYAITDLLKSHITFESLRNNPVFSYNFSKPYQNVLDRWNEFIFEIFNDWQDRMIDSDSKCPPRNSPKFISYVEKYYNYEVFCDESDENQALIDITCSGFCNL